MSSDPNKIDERFVRATINSGEAIYAEADLQSRLAQAEEQTKLEVTAAYHDAAEVAWLAYDRDDGDEIKECVLRRIPSGNAFLYERRMAERAFEEAMWWSDPKHSGEKRHDRIAELRRATAGKGQGE